MAICPQLQAHRRHREVKELNLFIESLLRPLGPSLLISQCARKAEIRVASVLSISQRTAPFFLIRDPWLTGRRIIWGHPSTWKVTQSWQLVAHPRGEGDVKIFNLSTFKVEDRMYSSITCRISRPKTKGVERLMKPAARTEESDTRHWEEHCSEVDVTPGKYVDETPV